MYSPLKGNIFIYINHNLVTSPPHSPNHNYMLSDTVAPYAAFHSLCFIFMLFLPAPDLFSSQFFTAFILPKSLCPTAHHALEFLCLPQTGRSMESQIQTHIHTYLVHSQMSVHFLCHISSLPATNKELKLLYF